MVGSGIWINSVQWTTFVYYNHFLLIQNFLEIFQNIHSMGLWVSNWILLFQVKQILLKFWEFFFKICEKLTFRKCGNACNNENNSSPGWTLCVAQIRFSFSFVPTLTWGKHTNVSFWKETVRHCKKNKKSSLIFNQKLSIHLQFASHPAIFGIIMTCFNLDPNYIFDICANTGAM